MTPLRQPTYGGEEVARRGPRPANPPREKIGRGEQRPRVTVDRWADVARIPVATAHLFLEDLALAGYAERLDGNWFSLTPRGDQLMPAIRALERSEAVA
jgi:hypothetical protein